jgi:hypothetical protein
MAERERGLRSINEAREERQRRKFGRPTGTFAVLVAAGILVVLAINYIWSEKKIGDQREDILKQQRAAVATLGAEWFPLRDKIESLVIESAKDWPGDIIAPDASKWDFRAMPGIYLRVRVADAKNVHDLRAAASESRRDGFTACLLRTQNAEDMDAGQSEDRPWNLRQAYASTRVLSDEWVNQVKTAGDEIRLRIFDEQYEKAKKEEIPLAVDIVKRAQFFLFVLDEDTPEAKAHADGGTITIEDAQLVPHPARIVLANLKTGQVEMRLRREGGGKFYLAGEGRALPEESREAMVRQVNNCALAEEVKRALKPAK